MRYIKTFESSGEEMDFDTFKEIMLDVVDMVESYEFTDNSSPRDEGAGDELYYSCKLGFKFNNLSIVDTSIEFIEGSFIPNAEDPEDIKTAKEVIKSKVSEIEEELYAVRNKIDGVVETNRKVLGIINHIDKYISPRFESISNHKGCLVGIDYINDDIVITATFEII